MNEPFDDHALATRHAIGRGEDALANIRRALECALRNVTESQQQYAQASIAEKARIVNHALSTACTWATVNAQLGLAADAQATLHALATQPDQA